MKKEEQIENSNYQLIEQGNLESVEKYFSVDYVAHGNDKEYKGHDFIKRFIKQLRTALPDISVKKIEFLVNEGNIIPWQHNLYGMHKFSLMGIPPSDKKIFWNEMIVSLFEGNDIVEEWVVSELAGQLLLKQPKGK